MAKPIQKVVSPSKSIIGHSFRLERIEAFLWQAYKVTLHSDGTFTEVKFYKQDDVPLVLNKISEAMRMQGAELLATKKASNG